MTFILPVDTIVPFVPIFPLTLKLYAVVVIAPSSELPAKIVYGYGDTTSSSAANAGRTDNVFNASAVDTTPDTRRLSLGFFILLPPVFDILSELFSCLDIHINAKFLCVFGYRKKLTHLGFYSEYDSRMVCHE